MINRTFDFQKSYRAVLYLRMSNPDQNPRSPEQQEAMIRERLKLMTLPWVVVKHYRDDGISGRFVRKRTGYQQMLREIRTGTVKADLILVDTTERFGRVEELQSIRRELWNHHGVLVLTADTNFADPTTPHGKAYSAFEAMRATEEGRVKAHQVVRGKRDHAAQHFWPGGPRPFGLRFSPVYRQIDGRPVLDGNRLEPHPEEAWIIRLAFSKADETGWGQTRLARFLTSHHQIPDLFKPFEPATVGRWLKNTIYYGELRWGTNTTDIVDDARVIQINDPNEVLHVPDFCEPIVAKDLWNTVNQLRLKRGAANRRAREGKKLADDKQLKAPAPGMVLKYLLTGLVRCGLCKRSMLPSSTKYTNTEGETTRYVTYVCPRYLDGTCPNGKRVPEAWLRKTVVAQITKQLFPTS